MWCCVLLAPSICLTDPELTEEEALMFEAESAKDLLERIWKALIDNGVDPESSDQMDLFRAAAGLSGSSAAAAAADTQGLGYWEPEGEFEEPVRPGLTGLLETGDGWMQLGVPGGRQRRLKKGSIARKKLAAAAAALKAAKTAKGFGGGSSSSSRNSNDGSRSSSNAASSAASSAGAGAAGAAGPLQQKKRAGRKGKAAAGSRSSSSGRNLYPGCDDNSIGALVEAFKESDEVRYEEEEEAAAAIAASDELAAAVAADDEVDVLQLQKLVHAMAGGETWGDEGSSSSSSSSTSSSSAVRQQLLAAENCQQLALLLLQLLPERVKGEKPLAAWARARGLTPPPPQRQQQQQQQAAAAAATAQKPRLTAADLLLAAVCWALRYKSRTFKARKTFVLHEALQVLVETVVNEMAAAEQQQQRGSSSSSSSTSSFFTKAQAAVFLRALLSADAPLPLPLLISLLQQLTTAEPNNSSSSSSSSSGGGSSSSGLDPLASSGLMWTLGTLNEQQAAGFHADLAPLVRQEGKQTDAIHVLHSTYFI
jgi:hypothetical protein